MNDSSQFMIDRITSATNTMNFYYSITIIPIGIILNIVTIIIFATIHRHKPTNSNLLYIGLSIYDLFALTNSILFAQLLPSLNIWLVNYSNTLCILLNWWRKIIIQSPSWVQVLITLERYNSVVSANKINVLKSKRNLIIMLFLIFLILFVVNMGHAWYFTIVTIKNSTVSIQDINNFENYLITNVSFVIKVTQVCSSTITVSLVTDAVNVFFRFLAPFTIMVVLNVLLSKNLFASKRRSTGSTRRSFKRERNYTITVIGFNILFFTLNLPWSVWFVMSHLQKAGLGFQSEMDAAILNLLNGVVFSIFYLNNLSSFILNMCFNKIFRSYFFFLAKSHLGTSSNNNSTIRGTLGSRHTRKTPNLETSIN